VDSYELISCMSCFINRLMKSLDGSSSLLESQIGEGRGLEDETSNTDMNIMEGLPDGQPSDKMNISSAFLVIGRLIWSMIKLVVVQKDMG
jgi:hypothetical protein